ncbi:acetate/propionate family kinase [Halioxenophilus aromaticivorans]|uniref:Acetate kinase n=1 Tax=Halioxenophilus aromaticivorans TaxID=1306992 RepID=A0AAV3U5I7_9ALTE
MEQVYLTLNAGSSNLKYSVYDAQVRHKLTAGKLEFKVSPSDSPDENALSLAVDRVVALVENTFGGDCIAAVGHRVVHGGDFYSQPILVDEEVLVRLKTLIPLAPLHLPAEINAVEIIRQHYPDMAQVVCFDTAFHATQMPLAQWFALPRALNEQGVKRYGFHGLSYQYISTQLACVLQPEHRAKVIVAHLGNGASLCAMQDGKSVTTTMGFTALDGLVMGTRCGELDAGVVLHLCQQQGMSLNEVQQLLYKQSGLLGVSGVSSDMRELERSCKPEALQARQLFCLRAAQKLAGLIPALNGLDAIVFCGGIGEHSAATRTMICDYLAWLGVKLDVHANSVAGAGTQSINRIHAEGSALGVYVIATNEELMIAQQSAALVSPH